MNDGLHWDQESPYPTRSPSISSSVSRPTSRAPSPTSNSLPFSHTTPSPPMPSQYSPPVPEKERRNSVRKSILKWKSQTSNGTAVPVPALLTSSSAWFRARKASLSSSPSQASPLNLPVEIPPSPRVPEQFISSFVGNHPPRRRPRLHRGRTQRRSYRGG
ncbi:hypothetical protein B0H12DRAFT_1237320 [Mycena haematopus]|nr:hypothetical protein B0H12DRAFT_1237320 [Mycena haematopus]